MGLLAEVVEDELVTTVVNTWVFLGAQQATQKVGRELVCPPFVTCGVLPVGCYLAVTVISGLPTETWPVAAWSIEPNFFGLVTRTGVTSE